MLEHLCQIEERSVLQFSNDKNATCTSIYIHYIYIYIQCHVGSESDTSSEDITHEYDTFMYEYNTVASDEEYIIHEYESGNDSHESPEQAIPPVAKGNVCM